LPGKPLITRTEVAEAREKKKRRPRKVRELSFRSFTRASSSRRSERVRRGANGAFFPLFSFPYLSLSSLLRIPLCVMPATVKRRKARRIDNTRSLPARITTRNARNKIARLHVHPLVARLFLREPGALRRASTSMIDGCKPSGNEEVSFSCLVSRPPLRASRRFERRKEKGRKRARKKRNRQESENSQIRRLRFVGALT